MGRRGAEVIYIAFSGIAYYILGPLFTTISLLNAYFYDLKSLAARISLSPGIKAARERPN